ncbi:hypothetical protein TNCV_4103591 [Trichonephila clavipes]|nr:hypothetical protein TNCV_4103591 [Trichonephila clavipes]
MTLFRLSRERNETPQRARPQAQAQLAPTILTHREQYSGRFIKEVQPLTPVPSSLETSSISSFTLSGVAPCSNYKIIEIRLTRKRLRRNIGLHEIIQRSRQTTIHFFLLTRNKNRLTRNDFPSGNEQIAENISRIRLSYYIVAVDAEFVAVDAEFVAVDDNNVCTKPIMEHKDIKEFVQSPKNIIDVDSDDKIKINDEALVPTSSEMRNIMAIMFSYLDAHYIGEMYNKMFDIQQFVDNLMLKKTIQRKVYKII